MPTEKRGSDGTKLAISYYDGPCHDPQCGDSTWDHECPLPPGNYIVRNGITYREEVTKMRPIIGDERPIADIEKGKPPKQDPPPKK